MRVRIEDKFAVLAIVDMDVIPRIGDRIGFGGHRLDRRYVVRVDWDIYVTGESQPIDPPKPRGRVDYAAQLEHVTLFVE